MTMTARFCDTSSSDGSCGSGRPLARADQRDAVLAEVEETRGDQAADHEHESTGTFGSANRSPP